MSHDEKVQKNFDIILFKKNQEIAQRDKQILDLEVQRNQDLQRIKELEVLVREYQVQIQLTNTIPQVKHIEPA